jgi:hypothetical protein
MGFSKCTGGGGSVDFFLPAPRAGAANTGSNTTHHRNIFFFEICNL